MLSLFTWTNIKGSFPPELESSEQQNYTIVLKAPCPAVTVHCHLAQLTLQFYDTQSTSLLDCEFLDGDTSLTHSPVLSVAHSTYMEDEWGFLNSHQKAEEWLPSLHFIFITGDSS